MLHQAFRALGLPVTRMSFQTQSRRCRFIFANGSAHLLANYFIFRVLDVIKTGDRDRYEYIELNDYHLKVVSGRPVIMRVFLWDRSYMSCSLRNQKAYLVGYQQ